MRVCHVLITETAKLLTRAYGDLGTEWFQVDISMLNLWVSNCGAGVLREAFSITVHWFE